MRETTCLESDLRDVLLVSVIASRVLGTEMRRIYQYKLFIVEVEALPVTGQGHGSGYASPQGYVALVTVRREGDTGVLFSPLRLGAASGRLFATEEDALATGVSAAQRVIDDTLSSD
ncbi:MULTISPECIES: hypothetical protein [Paraburkholderia]|uniref:hypothetical protein n=1 Tax=Paraburkholderia TaxID=1822464 RepID=UPI00035CC080|nr:MULTISPECIES: hypothetical protein [Paraburkholderia]MDH6149481.1 hypothetical protein [Paraburkholderia sp. WSM4179]